MANRYWVGGANTWNTTAGTKWALTSGGAGGQTVPTTSDDVFFDGNSGAVIVAMTNDARAKNLSLNGFTGTINWSTVQGAQIHGNLIGGANATISYSLGTGYISLQGTSITHNITTNGMSWISIYDEGTNSTISLQDTFYSIGRIQTTSNTIFTTNNYNLTFTGIIGTITVVSTGAVFNFGSSTLSTEIGWSFLTGCTVNAGTSTLKMVGTANVSTFNGNGYTFYNVWFDKGASTQINRVDGNNTFNQLRDTGTAAHEFRILNSSTQTMADWAISGNPGALITIRSTSSTTTHNLVKTGSGVVSADYLAIQYSQASPASTWYAGTNSVDNTNNTGWIFTAPPAIGPANLKTYNTNLKANIKTINTNPIANVKSLDTNV